MKRIYAYIVRDGVRYPVHSWRPKPEHGDWTTDIAFVLARALGTGAGPISVEEKA
jgi:hypothetical protein